MNKKNAWLLCCFLLAHFLMHAGKKYSQWPALKKSLPISESQEKRMAELRANLLAVLHKNSKRMPVMYASQSPSSRLRFAGKQVLQSPTKK